MSLSGSPRGFTWDGVPYNVKSDADVASNTGEEIEGIRHSGGVSFKSNLVPETMEAIQLIISPQEYDILKDSAKGVIAVAGFTFADGSVKQGKAMLNIGPHQSGENTCEVMAIAQTTFDTFGA